MTLAYPHPPPTFGIWYQRSVNVAFDEQLGRKGWTNAKGKIITLGIRVLQQRLENEGRLRK